jgi:hypothetical protein
MESEAASIQNFAGDGHKKMRSNDRQARSKFTFFDLCEVAA